MYSLGSFPGTFNYLEFKCGGKKLKMLTNKLNAMQLIVADARVDSRQSVSVNPPLISSPAPTVTRKKGKQVGNKEDKTTVLQL